LPAEVSSSFIEQRAGWLLVLAGPGLFIISYAVLGGLVPLAGSEASTDVALWSFAIAVAGFLSIALWLFIRAGRGRLAARYQP